MKNSIIFIITIFFSNYNFAQSNNNYSLTISIPNDFKCDSILISFDNKSGNIIDTTFKAVSKIVIKNRFKKWNKLENGISIYFKNNNYNLKDTLYLLYTENISAIKINDSIKYFKTGNIWELKNLENFEDLFVSYNNSFKIEEKKLNEYYLKEKNINSDTLINYQDKIIKKKFEFINRNINNTYTIEIFNHFIVKNNSINYKIAKEFYRRYLVKKIKDTQLKNNIEKNIENKKVSTTENVRMPPFVVTTIEGKVITDKDIRGNYILLHFWATWCSPCLDEIPIFKEIFKNYKNSNLKILFVSLDKDETKSKRFITENKIEWINIFDSENIIKQFGINPIPHTFLIDPKGEIIYNSIIRKYERTKLNSLKAILKNKLNIIPTH